MYCMIEQFYNETSPKKRLLILQQYQSEHPDTDLSEYYRVLHIRYGNPISEFDTFIYTFLMLSKHEARLTEKELFTYMHDLHLFDKCEEILQAEYTGTLKLFLTSTKQSLHRPYLFFATQKDEETIKKETEELIKTMFINIPSQFRQEKYFENLYEIALALLNEK